jgi:4-amino-4-deoxy-L-arabinose transferase-like glycosyltransferase
MSRRLAYIVVLVFALQILALIGTAFVFHAYGGSISHEVSQQDAAKFMGVADSLLRGDGFEQAGYQVPDTWLTPGYPLFVAAVFWLTHHSLTALLVVIALLGALTSGLLYLIGIEVGLTKPYATAGAVLFGISPAVMWLPASGMGGDMLFVFLLTLSLWALLKSRTSNSFRYVLILGLTLGLATLTRPIGLYVSLIFIAALFFMAAGTTLRKILFCGVALLLFVATLTPWMMRNYVVADHFSLSSQFAFNPFYYNIPAYLAFHIHTSESAERTKLITEVTHLPWDEHTSDPYILVNGFTYADELSAFDKRFLQQHFFSYVIFHTLKTIPFFVGSGVNVVYATITNEIPSLPDLPFFPKATENTSTLFYGGHIGSVLRNLLYYWPATLERMVWLVVFLLALVSPFLTRGKIRTVALLGVVTLLMVAALSSPIAQPRYRVPVEPFLWVLALLSLQTLSQKWERALLFVRSSTHKYLA